MKPVVAFQKACDIATSNITRIKPAQWHDSTPCDEWDLRALVHHMVYEVLWVPDMMSGKSVEMVGDTYEGDILGRNPKKAWEAATAKALKVMQNPAAMRQTVHLSYGDVSGSHYCSEIASDIFIHAWDVATAAGLDTTLDPEMVEFVYGFMAPRADEMRSSGLFGDQVVEVSIKTEFPARLLALYGRVE